MLNSSWLWSISAPLYCKLEMETGRVDRPVGLPVGSRFFDRPVKPVETPVKFYFLAPKRHLSTNRNIHIYIIINEAFFYKKTVLTNHTFWKHLLNGFKLRPLRHKSRTYLEGTIVPCSRCHPPPPLWATAQSKKVQNIRWNRVIRL